ncbi:MAG: hypothetical protein U0V48_19245 [Anaerolineales bacterium]
MIFFASIEPVFEWQISNIIIDAPSSYEVRIAPSPWIAIIGDSLNDKSYVFNKVAVLNDGMYCSSRGFNVVVKRSQNDELLDRLSLAFQINDSNIYRVTWWILIEIAISLVYILWFTIWHEHRPVSYAISSAVIATMCFCFLIIPMMRLMGPRFSYGGMATCHGTIRFSAELSEVNYSVPTILLAGVFAELVAFVIMVYQVVKMIRNRKESSK